MKAENLRAIQPKKFVPKTTNSKHGKLASRNLLTDEANQPSAKAQVIIGDIRYLPLANEQWCYPAVWRHKFTRRIVDWVVAAAMTAALVIKAFDKAVFKGLIKLGAIIHTGRGWQCVATGFRARLAVN